MSACGWLEAPRRLTDATRVRPAPGGKAVAAVQQLGLCRSCGQQLEVPAGLDPHSVASEHLRDSVRCRWYALRPDGGTQVGVRVLRLGASDKQFVAAAVEALATRDPPLEGDLQVEAGCEEDGTLDRAFKGILDAEDFEAGDLLPHEAVLGPDVGEARMVECCPQGVDLELRQVEVAVRQLQVRHNLTEMAGAGTKQDRELVDAWEQVFVALASSTDSTEEGLGLAARVRGGPQAPAGSRSLRHIVQGDELVPNQRNPGVFSVATLNCNGAFQRTAVVASASALAEILPKYCRRFDIGVLCVQDLNLSTGRQAQVEFTLQQLGFIGFLPRYEALPGRARRPSRTSPSSRKLRDLGAALDLLASTCTVDPSSKILK
eukprot:SAG11_NODE_1011_length_6195_cov_4.901247_6_plen_375_part_00